MKKLSISLLVLMLGTAVLTGCSKSSGTHLKTESETQSQWGLTMYDDSTETAAENETESGSENETEEDSVTELDNGVLLLELENAQVQSTSNVNVRSGPGTDYDKAGSLSESEEVTMTGICSNGWIRISFDGDAGYVLMDYLESADAEVSLSSLLERVQSLQAGSGGEDSSDESSAEQSGTDETGSDESSSADNGESSSDESSESGKETGSAEGDGELAWAVTDVNIRKGPKSTYEVLGYLKQGESVKVLDSTDAWWWKVEFNGQEAYVSVQYLTTEKPAE